MVRAPRGDVRRLPRLAANRHDARVHSVMPPVAAHRLLHPRILQRIRRPHLLLRRGHVQRRPRRRLPARKPPVDFPPVRRPAAARRRLGSRLLCPPRLVRVAALRALHRLCRLVYKPGSLYLHVV